MNKFDKIQAIFTIKVLIQFENYHIREKMLEFDEKDGQTIFSKTMANFFCLGS